MSSASETLRNKFVELLSWERRKRREQILATASCYALLAALLTLPFHGVLQTVISRWFVPISFFGLMAPLLLVRERWRRSDSARALARVDKTLRLDERALTAWELLERNETRAAALLVLKEAGEKLTSLHPRAMFRRRWSWQAYAALPLLVLWLGLVWFDVGLRFDSDLQLSAPKSVAQKLREFARELQEKAKNEGLHESLRMGRELEQVAQKGIEAKTGDEKFKAELAGMQKKIATMGKSAAEQQPLAAAESQQELKDLKAELEAARDLLNLPDAAKGMPELGKQWLDQLAALPQLRKQFERQSPAGQSLGHNELKSFLDKLEKQATGELDRRTLLDAQQFLEQLMKQGQGEKGESDVRMAGQGEQDSPDDGERMNNRSNLPGKEPGKRETESQSLPSFQPGAAAHVKGLLGEGNSSGLVLKAKPSAGKSEVSQDEVIASYRRQAEVELNTERVPEALKETIKNYFLSLGLGEGNQ
ncbi:MAG TPA: hypothetical protein VLJ79_31420 [Candidatus Binatia bacterium]|nr:hypothetical protein [Candidatus Binatia bacterium]